MMNIERLIQVRDWLAAGGEDGVVSFVMKDYITPARKADGWPTCNTTCCIGLSINQWGNLCFPHPSAWNGRSPYDATAEEAAKVVDHLIKTGKVDWAKAFEN